MVQQPRAAFPTELGQLLGIVEAAPEQIQQPSCTRW
jgi:hypothetical protein